jgi:hypothetical protein
MSDDAGANTDGHGNANADRRAAFLERVRRGQRA